MFLYSVLYIIVCLFSFGHCIECSSSIYDSTSMLMIFRLILPQYCCIIPLVGGKKRIHLKSDNDIRKAYNGCESNNYIVTLTGYTCTRTFNTLSYNQEIIHCIYIYEVVFCSSSNFKYICMYSIGIRDFQSLSTTHQIQNLVSCMYVMHGGLLSASLS